MTSKNSDQAAVYSRYSTDKQDPSSIEDQVRVCIRLIEQRGYCLSAVYSDAAMSGATAARPGLRQLLAGTPVKGQREIDPAEAEIVVRIFRDYADGRSGKAIAAGLNKDGVPGARGGIWRQNTINGNRARGTGILNNELYAGWLVWNRLEYRTKAVDLGGHRAELRKSTSKPRVSRLRPADQIVRVPLPELRIVPQDLWDMVKARQKTLDTKLKAQQAANGGHNRRAGIGATRRSLTVLAGVLSCGTCGGKMTPSGGRYLRCSTAAETGGSVYGHTRNCRRERIEAHVLAALSDDLMRPDALEHFIKIYNGEVVGATARRTEERQALEAELARADRKIANLVTAIAGGLNNPSVKARLDELEAERAVFAAESEKPAPAAIHMHPGAASLWRAKIGALRAALDEGDGAAMTRETLRGLFERVTLCRDRTAEAGFVVELEGRLAEMLQVVGIKKADAELVDSASAVSGQLVAGAGFEPATFRL